jgi:hypothetical protein
MAFFAKCIVFVKTYYNMLGKENAFFVSRMDMDRVFGCADAALG